MFFRNSPYFFNQFTGTSRSLPNTTKRCSALATCSKSHTVPEIDAIVAGGNDSPPLRYLVSPMIVLSSEPEQIGLECQIFDQQIAHFYNVLTIQGELYYQIQRKLF